MCSRVWGIGPSAAETTRIAAVHLGGAGDHVLDEVGVARAVDVGVVPLVGLVLDVADGDRHRLGLVADGAALGDIGVRLELGQALGRLDGQDARR